MERVRRLVQLWSYLPAFRAVAETEHLPTAARALSVTAPALSRSIRLLESQLGEPLFSRQGRRICLNDAGKTLLSAVRDAMRRLDDGLESIAGRSELGPVRISVPSELTQSILLPALAKLALLHPGLVPEVTAEQGERAHQNLRTGALDLVITSRPIGHPDLVVEPVATQPRAVYCGPRHALYRRRRITLAELLAHTFAAAASGEDSWPPHLERRVAMRLHPPEAITAACGSGRYLAVLLEAQAAHAHGARLRALPVPRLPDQEFYAVYRRPVGSRGRAELVLESLPGRQG